MVAGLESGEVVHRIPEAGTRWRLKLAVTNQGAAAISILEWPESDDMEYSRPEIEIVCRPAGRSTWIRRMLESYLSRAVAHCLIPADLSGTTRFQQAVYRITRAIPPGCVATYGWIAARLGRGGCSRAVGRALGSNPVPLAVPCHRVVSARGLGGFSGGRALKKALLRLEGWKEGGLW